MAEEPAEAAGEVAGAVARLRGEFGLGWKLAELLGVAARGCPVQEAPSASERVRGVFPLPYLRGEREGAGQALRAGARRKQVHRARGVSKTNFALVLLNLFFGGVACMVAGCGAKEGAAQSAAVRRVARVSGSWDFSPEIAEVEALAKQPTFDYGMGQELHAAVDTDPQLILVAK